MSKQENIISSCEGKLWKTETELQALASLFCGLSDNDLSDDSLFGMGLTLKRVSMRLQQVREKLAQLEPISGD